MQSFISFLENDMDSAALAIGSVTGFHPGVAWAKAPWFNDERFLGTVSADALAEAAMRTMDDGHDLDTETMRERFRPWFHAIDVVSARQSLPEALAKMAILLRACGLTDASLTLCDRADSIERIMLTEVVRAGTWRKLGDPEWSTAAFERALVLDPSNWSFLDLAKRRVRYRVRPRIPPPRCTAVHTVRPARSGLVARSPESASNRRPAGSG